MLAPVMLPVTYTLRLTPDTSAVRATVESQLRDLHSREAGLGQTPVAQPYPRSHQQRHRRAGSPTVGALGRCAGGE